MKKFKEPKLILFLIICLTFLSAGVEKAFPDSFIEIVKSGKPLNILLLGIDARPGEINARSDTIILVSIDCTLNKAALVWIPRDTKIYTSNKSQKINMINQFHGPEATCKEVGKLLDINVNHFILTNFSGFENIIDILGGIYMYVDIDLSSPSSGVYLKKGYQHLNGKQALKYARYRDKEKGDIGRTERQQKLLQALKNQVFKKETIIKIPDLLPELQKNILTNISASDMFYLLNLLLQIDKDIITQTLPGTPYNDPYSGASYWIVDPQVARSILNSLFHGHRFEIETCSF